VEPTATNVYLSPGRQVAPPVAHIGDPLVSEARDPGHGSNCRRTAGKPYAHRRYM
jgi:hypothetical protein